jgi:hypothetical protein
VNVLARWFGVMGLLAVVAACPCQAQASSDAREFPRLAALTVAVAGPKARELAINLRSFAADELLIVQEGNFTRQGREVISMKISLDDQTFFQADNFRHPAQFEVSVYSHSAKDAWWPIWSRLVKKVEQDFGAQNVQRILIQGAPGERPPPGSNHYNAPARWDDRSFPHPLFTMVTVGGAP